MEEAPQAPEESKDDNINQQMNTVFKQCRFNHKDIDLQMCIGPVENSKLKLHLPQEVGIGQTRSVWIA